MGSGDKCSRQSGVAEVSKAKAIAAWSGTCLDLDYMRRRKAERAVLKQNN
jgi:hypothetical protein